MKTFITLPVKQQLLYRFRSALLLSVLLLTGLHSHAQLILNSPNTLGTYSDRKGIRLDSGFSSFPTTGQHFKAYTDTTVVQPMAEKPSNSQNYVITYNPRIPGIAKPGDTTLTNAQVMVGIQYTDGLGRPRQNIQVKGSPGGNDMIQPFAYDTTGRQTTQYLPYTVVENNSGTFRSFDLTEQSTYYNPSTPGAADIATTAYPTASTLYELSPLNRVLEQGAPGADWQLGQHTQGIVYTTNDTASVSSGGHWAKNYVVQSNGSLAAGTAFAPGMLSVTITHDENWSSGNGRLGTVESYTDKDGHMILKRTFNYNTATSATEIMSTYYVYDALGNIHFVLPPSVNPDNPTSIPSSTALKTQCFQYVYDGQNRLIGKNIPGKGMNYTLYNQLDLPAVMQDSVQSGNQQWTAYKYDVNGRLIMGGVWNVGSSPALSTLQDSINRKAPYDKRDTTNTTTGYAISSYPAVSHALTINYYDDYNIPNLPSAYDLHTDTACSIRTQGLLTATKTAVLKPDGSISSDMLWTVYYYDNKGRVIKTIKQHYLGGSLSVYNYDEVIVSYDFNDNPTQAIRNHYAKNSGNTAAVLGVSIKDSVVYDHMGRPVQAWNQINSQAKVLLTQADYNELGQGITRHIHSTDGGSSFLQNVSYAYNEHGQLTKNSAPLFAEQLKYNDGTTPQYNGNIANQLWGKPDSLNSTFTYSYDKVNRLTSGSSAHMAETGISYDLAGNIQSLTRDGNTISYTYNSTSNQLSSVSGTGVSSGTYSYDANGNMLHDGSNGYTFSNNLLNLPRQISNGTQTMSYTYDAAGNKLSKSNNLTGLTEYVNGIQYGSNTGSYGIDKIPVSGGWAERKTDGSYRYVYGLEDHLGNVRATIQQNPTTLAADVLQQDDYYPFGSKYTLTAGDNQYLYNGKEEQEEISQYDYGARYYNPAIGRWNGVDQMAESYSSRSPYNYVGNNPINFFDPNGLWDTDGDGNVYSDSEDDTVESLGRYLDNQYDTDYYETESGAEDLGAIFRTLSDWDDGTDVYGLGAIYGHTLSVPVSEMDTGSEFDYGTGIDPTQLYGQGYANWGNGGGQNEVNLGATFTATATDFETNFSNGVIDTKVQGYHGVVIGKEGKYGTANINATPQSIGLDTNFKLGFLGFGTSDDSASISFNFGQNTYTFGMSETDGMFQDVSSTNNGMILGTRYSYTINPNGAVIVGAFSVFGNYLYNSPMLNWAY